METTINKQKSYYNGALIGLILMFFLLIIFLVVFPYAAGAQDAPQSSTVESVVAAESKGKLKPKLVPIILNEENSDPEAVEIAKKLDKVYSDLVPTDTNRFKYFARFIKYNESEFLIYNPTDLYTICNAGNCPFILYKKIGNNQWKEVEYFYGQSLVYDLNSNNKKYPNVIVRSNTLNFTNNVRVFIWNGLTYRSIAG